MSKAGKKYEAAKKQIEPRPYTVEDAMGLLKKVHYAKFNETIEVHMRLGVDPKHADQMVRGTIVLPHGLGKSKTVCVIASGDKIKEAEQAGAEYVGGDDMVETVVATPDLGDTRAELVAFVGAAVRILGKTLMGRVMQGLVSDLATDPDLARAFRERVVAVRLAEVKRVFERGIERGDLRPDADFELAHELLFGPVYYRLLLSGAPLDEALAGRIVNAVYPVLAAKP